MVFNVGNRRRIASKGDNADGSKHSHAFFDPQNKAAKSIRDDLAMDSLEELIAWLKQGGRVGIHGMYCCLYWTANDKEDFDNVTSDNRLVFFISSLPSSTRTDATNSTRERRKMLLKRLESEPNCRVLFIESICTDPIVLAQNITMKLSSPDYKGVNEQTAREDFRKRLENYEKAYQTLGDEEEDEGTPYCKLVNVGKKVIAYNIQGYLAGQCIFYLMNFNLSPRCIWLTRHGESMDNIVGKIGGDAPLSPKGRKFAACLARFIQHEREEHSERVQMEQRAGMFAPSNIADRTVAVWTSMLTRTKETVEGFDPNEYDIKHMRLLNEIYAGVCEELTYTEIRQKYPQEFEARRVNKLYYRYPGMGGESYVDVIQRLNPLIVELERIKSSLLIVTHRVVLRILLSYLMDIDRGQMPEMEVQLHTVYRVEPRPHGTILKVFRWDEDRDWFYEDSVTPFP
ncbi:hypothetical protein BGW42_000803 [Actinomortierella wolfii]|nr:hypothetical protein BGW42_000803 [Actinomortierella wolfii]